MILVDIAINTIGVALYSLLVSWVITLILPVPLDQILWLVLGTVILLRYILQFFTNQYIIVGYFGFFWEIFFSNLLSLIIITISIVLEWLLLKIVSVNLTIFQTILLFDITLIFGLFFSLRGGLQKSKFLDYSNDYDDEDDDEIEEEEKYVPPPPPKPSHSKSKTKKQ